MGKQFFCGAILLACLFVSSAKYVDELNVSEDCVGEDIECTDGGCISHDQYCDGVLDCKDGWDESFCGPRKFSSKCNSTHQHLCKDRSMCIGEELLCDNKTDCTDGSDEKNCTRLDLMIKNMSKKVKGCKGFGCDDDRCISNLWICDGKDDCLNANDEVNKTLCNIIKNERVNKVYDVRKCNPSTLQSPEYFQCDSVYCLPKHKVCDGEKDCRDGTDEGPYCDKWSSMCQNFTCNTEGAGCRETPAGPRCRCPHYMISHSANNSCVDRDDCALVVPECSQKCENFYRHFKCSCEDGYYTDSIGTYQCFAPDPEGILFYTTSRDIRYYKLKSKGKKVAVQIAKQPHGVAYDGNYLYWIENAQGYESILRAKLNDVTGTKQVILALGLEEPGNIAIDWIGQHLYFTDVARGHIGVCNMNGTVCTVLNTTTKNPNYVTLHPQAGEMYWSDWYKESPVIMRAKMDGSNASVFVDGLQQSPTGLTLDLPSGRMYFADKDIYVLMLDSGKIQKLLSEEKTHAFSLAVFENMIYWSDWRTNSIQASTKIQPRSSSRKILVTSPVPCYGIHIFHPLLMKQHKNPCENSHCSHMCLLNGNGTFVCACPEGRKLVNETTCVITNPDERHQYLIIGGGQNFTKIHYNWLGNPEELITFDIGYVQAMAFDNSHRILYIYDGIHKAIKYIHFDDFSKGETKVLLYRGLVNVVDMDYDYVSNSLYIVDASRRMIEVISLKTKSRAIIHRFKDYEIPISICVIPDYGRLMVALIEHEQNNDIHIDSMGLDGNERRHILETGLKGPRISLRYSPEMDNVFISDEGSGIIQQIHPTGTGQEDFRSLATTVTSLAVSDATVFWTDRRTPRLFWANIHESQKIRRLELTLYPNYTQIHLQAMSLPPDLDSPLMQHPCFKKYPCSDICVQTAHRTIHEVTMEHYMGYTCLCPSGFLLKGEKCEAIASCEPGELYCHHDNTCAKGKSCNGVAECPNDEDEMHCDVTTELAFSKCQANEVLCYGACISNNLKCTDNATNNTPKTACNFGEFQCENFICLQRWERCDGEKDCPDGSDETNCDNFECFDFEFRCASGSCIPVSWKCDKDYDCRDGSDEINCFNKTCDEGMFQCMSGDCVDISKRCDAQNDCLDFTDERECIDENDAISYIEDLELKCEDFEYACINNRSICLPYSARCDGKADCPDGSDETECDPYCPKSLGLFRCDLDTKCLQPKYKCDGRYQCDDKTDEMNCANETKTTTASPVVKLPCRNGFACRSGQCIQWEKACDRKSDCHDGSDEGVDCAKACDDHDCDFTCQATPEGGICLCPPGFKMDAHLKRCFDIDECAAELCSQKCYNVPGSFFCSCHHGYALRSNQRTCKAINRNMVISFVSDAEIFSMNRFHGPMREFNATMVIPSITDFDMNIRKNSIYIICNETGELMRVANQTDYFTVTNVGRPVKLALDWVTDNIYFVDSTPSAQRIKVCNLAVKRCANLQKLPIDAQVTAFIVDPANGRMFYCLNLAMETVVWSASLAGHQAKDLLTGHNCTGLTVDSFKKRLYIVQRNPDSIIHVDYEGNSLKLVEELSRQIFFQSPNGLALFEDSLYFRHGSTTTVSRCSLFGSKLCEPMIFRGYPTTKFLVKHESTQRDDVVNSCEKAMCSSICVLASGGSQCVCADGTFTVSGSDCRPQDDKDMPYFKGPVMSIATESNTVTGTVLISLLCIIIVLVLAFFGFRRYKKKNSERQQLVVRFQNTASSPLTEDDSPEEPIIDIPEHSHQHEFINPIEIFRNVWRRSRRRQRPVGGGALDEPTASARTGSSSDTESLEAQESTSTLFKNQTQQRS